MRPVEEVTGLRIILAKVELRHRNYQIDLRKVDKQIIFLHVCVRKLGYRSPRG